MDLDSLRHICGLPGDVSVESVTLQSGKSGLLDSACESTLIPCFLFALTVENSGIIVKFVMRGDKGLRDTVYLKAKRPALQKRQESLSQENFLSGSCANIVCILCCE